MSAVSYCLTLADFRKHSAQRFDTNGPLSACQQCIAPLGAVSTQPHGAAGGVGSSRAAGLSAACSEMGPLREILSPGVAGEGGEKEKGNLKSL